MSLRNGLFAIGFIATLISLARASQAEACSSDLAATLLPIISICVSAQSFCSAHYPQQTVTTTITGSETVTQTVSTSLDIHSTATTVTVTAAIHLTTTAPTITQTSSTVTVSLVASTTTTTSTSTSTDTTQVITATATCPPFNGKNKRMASGPSWQPTCRKIPSTITKQDSCSSALRVLSSANPIVASDICNCFSPPVTFTQTTTPTVSTVVSSATTITTTITTTVTPTDVVTPTITLHPTVTVTPAVSTYTSTASAVTTTTINRLKYDGGELIGSSSCGCHYLVTCGINPSGQIFYTSYTASSIQDCVNSCSNTRGRCQSASFQISNKMCSLSAQSYYGGGENNLDFVAIGTYFCNNNSCYH